MVKRPPTDFELLKAIYKHHHDDYLVRANETGPVDVPLDIPAIAQQLRVTTIRSSGGSTITSSRNTPSRAAKTEDRASGSSSRDSAGWRTASTESVRSCSTPEAAVSRDELAKEDPPSRRAFLCCRRAAGIRGDASMRSADRCHHRAGACVARVRVVARVRSDDHDVSGVAGDLGSCLCHGARHDHCDIGGERARRWRCAVAGVGGPGEFRNSVWSGSGRSP